MTVDEFEDEVRGAVWRWQRWEDVAGMISVHALMAAGVTKRREGEPPPPDQGEPFTLEDLLGRPPVSLIDPPALTEAEREAQEWAEAQAAAKRDRANLMLYRMQLERAKREHGGGPEIVSGS